MTTDREFVIMELRFLSKRKCDNRYTYKNQKWMAERFEYLVNKYNITNGEVWRVKIH